MVRRISPSLRAARFLTALATVWCLGCSGFEPLLDALLGGAGAGMACTPGAGAADEMPAMAAMGDEQAPDATTVSSSAEQGSGFDCGCAQTCQASSVASATIATPPATMPRVAAVDVTQPSSVARTPLLPPPERTL